jgi:hypothetical protein
MVCSRQANQALVDISEKHADQVLGVSLPLLLAAVKTEFEEARQSPSATPTVNVLPQSQTESDTAIVPAQVRDIHSTFVSTQLLFLHITAAAVMAPDCTTEQATVGAGRESVPPALPSHSPLIRSPSSRRASHIFSLCSHGTVFLWFVPLVKALPNGFLSVASQRSAALNQKLERLAFHLSCILVPPAREGKQTLSEDPFTIKIPPTSPQRAAVIDTFRSSFTIPILSCFTSASALDASIIFAGGQFIISTQLLNFVADIFREITQSLPTKYAVLRRRKRK